MVDENFLEVFSTSVDYGIEPNTLSLFSVKIENNKFKYSNLVDLLFDVFINFCKSPKGDKSQAHCKFVNEMNLNFRIRKRKYTEFTGP